LVFVVGAAHVMVALDVLGVGSGAGVTVEAGGGVVLCAGVCEESEVDVELEVAGVDGPSFSAGSGFSTEPLDADAVEVLGEPSAPHPESDRIAVIAISAAGEKSPLR
jgi:hypothetical protein